MVNGEILGPVVVNGLRDNFQGEIYSMKIRKNLLPWKILPVISFFHVPYDAT